MRRFMVIATCFAVISGMPATTTVATHWSNRLIGGEPATSGQFPYQAAIRTRDDLLSPEYPLVTSGALITPQAVLTSAIIAAGNDFFIIMFGTIEAKPDPNSVIINSTSLFIHPGYSQDDFSNNLAVLILDFPVNVTELIIPISLPTSDDIEVDSTVLISGWGATYNNGVTTAYPDTLRFLRMSTISNDQCRLIYGNNVLTDDMFCTNGASTDNSCTGDAGDPVVNYNGNLLGIVSITNFDCTGPTVITSVFHYVDWIRSIIY